MKGLALAAACVAVLGLTACSHSESSHQDAASGARQGAGKAGVPVSCSAQYRSWTKGKGKGVMVALDSVASAATSGDAQGLTTALHQAKPAVAKAARHPIPACADPRGYWSVLLMHVNAATGSKTSASSARAAVQDVPKIHHTLVAEVKKTAQ